MASRVDFYHVTRDAVPAVLARLAERVLSGGNRLLVVAAERALREELDVALWVTVPASFLPHAPADQPGGDLAADPIVIAAVPDHAIADGMEMIALADGRWRDEALEFARTLFLFDGQGIDDARAAWRTLSKRTGVKCHYWKQDEAGRWREGP